MPLSKLKTKTGKTNSQGRVEFTGETDSTYSYKITNDCGTAKSGQITTHSANASYTAVIDTFSPEKGNIVITNNSTNLYTVTVNNENRTIQGKASLTLSVKTGAYTVSWEQNSGYLSIPTPQEAKM